MKVLDRSTMTWSSEYTDAVVMKERAIVMATMSLCFGCIE